MPDEVWATFTTAGFTCWCPGPVTVRPAPPGTREGPFPFADPATFVTPDNPQGRVVPEAENVRRRAALAAALDQLGAAWVPAVGGSGGHQEPGAVVLDLEPAAVLGLAARFDQAAVYVWEPDALHLVACAGDRHDALGYRASPGPPSCRPRHLRRPSTNEDAAGALRDP